MQSTCKFVLILTEELTTQLETTEKALAAKTKAERNSRGFVDEQQSHVEKLVPINGEKVGCMLQEDVPTYLMPMTSTPFPQKVHNLLMGGLQGIYDRREPHP